MTVESINPESREKATAIPAISVLIFHVSFWISRLDRAFPQCLNDIEGEISAVLKHMNETIESTIIVGIFDNVDDFQV